MIIFLIAIFVNVPKLLEIYIMISKTFYQYHITLEPILYLTLKLIYLLVIIITRFQW